MEYHEACTALAKHIRQQPYLSDSEAGLMIQVFADAISESETPAMSLALAKNMGESL